MYYTDKDNEPDAVARRYDEAGEIVEKWGKIGLLKDLKTKHHKKVAAVVLENQRLINEIVSEREDKYEDQQFRRLSIPLARRVFGNVPFMDLVSVQPLLGPTGLCYFKDVNGKYHSDAVPARTRFLRTRWPVKDLEYRQVPMMIDVEAEVAIQLAVDLADDIAHEIIKDLCNNCTLDTLNLIEGDQPTALSNAVLYGSVSVRDLIGKHKANWLVVSEKMLGLFGTDLADKFHPWAEEYLQEQRRVFHAGYLEIGDDKLQVYCDRNFADEKILFGYKGEDPHESPYSYCPYVFITKTPPTVLEDGTVKVGLMTRYAKKLHNGGSRYFRLVTLNNVKFLEPAADMTVEETVTEAPVAEESVDGGVERGD